jgi:hypothetical protein
MSRYYRIKRAGPAENLKAGLVAGGIAAAVAAASFYLTRVFLSREALEPLTGSPSEGEGEGEADGGRA